MKRKLCIVSIVCLVSLMMSAFECEGQDIEYLLKIGHLKPHQAFFQAPLSPQLSNRTELFADVENKAQRGEKPPLSGGRITGEILVGGVGGIVGGLGGGFIGAGVAGEGYPDELVGGIIGGSIGYTLGSSIGVYLVGNIGNETGDFLATLGGGILGGLAGIFAITAIIKDYNVVVLSNFYWSWAVVLVGPPIGATIGFNLTRRYKSPPASDSQMSPAALPIYFNLVRVRF